MVDAFFVLGEVLAEAFGEFPQAGPVLVVVPSGVLSLTDYLELAGLKKSHRQTIFEETPSFS